MRVPTFRSYMIIKYTQACKIPANVCLMVRIQDMVQTIIMLTTVENCINLVYLHDQTDHQLKFSFRITHLLVSGKAAVLDF